MPEYFQAEQHRKSRKFHSHVRNMFIVISKCLISFGNSWEKHIEEHVQRKRSCCVTCGPRSTNIRHPVFPQIPDTRRTSWRFCTRSSKRCFSCKFPRIFWDIGSFKPHSAKFTWNILHCKVRQILEFTFKILHCNLEDPCHPNRTLICIPMSGSRSPYAVCTFYNTWSLMESATRAEWQWWSSGNSSTNSRKAVLLIAKVNILQVGSWRKKRRSKQSSVRDGRSMTMLTMLMYLICIPGGSMGMWPWCIQIQMCMH